MDQLSPINPETVNQIQENLIAYFRLFAGLPGVTFVEEADVTWIASKGFPGNLVLRSQLPVAGLDQRLDEILHRIGQTTHAVDWFVFPSCLPIWLGEQLATRGGADNANDNWRLVGQAGGPGGDWLVADLAMLPSAPPVADRFHIEAAQDQPMLEKWLMAFVAGFGHDVPALEKIKEHTFYAAYARRGFGPDADALHAIGYLDEQPVTSASLFLAGGIASLFTVSTPPAFRRQGFGSAISWAMLQEAQTRGYAQAYVWSSTLGKSVYQGIGFVPIALGMREYSWQKR